VLMFFRVTNALSSFVPLEGSSNASAAAEFVPTRSATDFSSSIFRVRASWLSYKKNAVQPRNMPMPLVNMVSASNLCRSDARGVILPVILTLRRFRCPQHPARHRQQLRADSQVRFFRGRQVDFKRHHPVLVGQLNHPSGVREVARLANRQRRRSVQPPQDLGVVLLLRPANERDLATAQVAFLPRPADFHLPSMRP